MSEIQGGKIDSHHVKNELDERLEEEKNILEAKEKLNRCERLCEKAVEEYEIDDKECNAKIDSSQNSMEGSKYGEFPETSANNDDEANPNLNVDNIKDDNTKEVVVDTKSNENKEDGKDMPMVNQGENMDELSANAAKLDVKMDNVEVDNVEEDNIKELGTKTNENNGDGKDMPMVNQGENMDEISANEAKQDLKVDNVKEVETREVNSNSNDNNENGNGMIMLNKVENMDEISANEAKPDLKEHDTKEVNAKSNKNKESEKDMPSVNKKQSLEETTISDSNSKVKEEDTMGHKEAEVKKGSDSLIKTRSVDILVDNNKEINGDRVNENTKEINEDKNDVPFVNKGTNVDDANSGVYVEDNVKDEDTQVQREMSPNVKPPKENINHQKKGN